MSIPKSKLPKSRPDAASRRAHYFDPQPVVASRPHTVRLHLRDLDLELHVDRGVFAYRGVDLGTQTLLREAPAPPAEGEILDLGCGYGAIGVALALRAPRARVWAVDINERALELTRTNATAAGAENVVVCTPDEIPGEVAFDAIYSNPPVRVGKGPLHEILLRWLARLRPGGRAYWWCSATSAPTRWRRGWAARVRRSAGSSRKRGIGSSRSPRRSLNRLG
jgi:16S rRNA G1207 methylase RsmC